MEEIYAWSKGYRETEHAFYCMHCAKRVDKNEVFPLNGRWFVAEEKIKEHLRTYHRSAVDALFEKGHKALGLTENQFETLHGQYQGLTDEEILQQSTAKSLSTIRQYRFQVRERYRQAVQLVALLEAMEQADLGNEKEIHQGAKQVDERYAITSEERQNILDNYMKEGKIHTMPRKEKRKIVLLQEVIKELSTDKQYSEKELNEWLKEKHEDFVALRRYLIEYGLMERTADGAAYWVSV